MGIGTLNIILLAAGAIVSVVSYIMPEMGSELEQIDPEVTKKQIRELIDKEMKDVKEQVSDIVEETSQYSVEKTERALERLTNEKINAVSEYTDTVMEDIHKSHEEVVFLYDMLNSKHEDLKETVSAVSAGVKEARVVEEALANASSQAENTLAQQKKSESRKDRMVSESLGNDRSEEEEAGAQEQEQVEGEVFHSETARDFFARHENTQPPTIDEIRASFQPMGFGTIPKADGENERIFGRVDDGEEGVNEADPELEADADDEQMPDDETVDAVIDELLGKDEDQNSFQAGLGAEDITSQVLAAEALAEMELEQQVDSAQQESVSSETEQVETMQAETEQAETEQAETEQAVPEQAEIPQPEIGAENVRDEAAMTDEGKDRESSDELIDALLADEDSQTDDEKDIQQSEERSTLPEETKESAGQEMVSDEGNSEESQIDAILGLSGADEDAFEIPEEIREPVKVTKHVKTSDLDSEAEMDAALAALVAGQNAEAFGDAGMTALENEAALADTANTALENDAAAKEIAETVLENDAAAKDGVETALENQAATDEKSDIALQNKEQGGSGAEALKELKKSIEAIVEEQEQTKNGEQFAAVEMDKADSLLREKTERPAKPEQEEKPEAKKAAKEKSEEKKQVKDKTKPEKKEEKKPAAEKPGKAKPKKAATKNNASPFGSPGNIALQFGGPGQGQSMNHNERILELNKKGKSNIAIAKELGLGVGEVKLVIDLYKGMK
ncbi:MAG: hypothetical protein IKR58_03910 [Lachnospiraceae bacterium]|nr:hypothetical protein [Lachnospiraceae bacterium]